MTVIVTMAVAEARRWSSHAAVSSAANAPLRALMTLRLGVPHDERVEPVLGRERPGEVGTAAGEGGDAPLRGVRRVLGVPGLVGAEEVAQTEVDDPHGGGGPPVAGVAREPDDGSGRAHIVTTLVGMS